MEQVVGRYKNWLSRYEKDDPWLRENRLDKYQSKLNRYKKALDRKAAIGVYGESQAGKSYLISALLKENEKNLNINIGKSSIPFTKLNPDQGSEATAVICRYTKHFNNGVPEGSVRGELHTIGEIVRILFGAINELDLSSLADKLKDFSFETKNIPSGNTKVSVQDVYDLLDHLHDLQLELGKQHVFYESLGKVYSIIQSEYIDSLSLTTLEYLLSFLWNGFDTFEKNVSEIFRFYKETGIKQDFFIDSNLVRDVLNTKTLYHAHEDGNRFSIEGGSPIRIREGKTFFLSTLQIACSELILPCDNDSKILKEVDLLDFPGLRPFAAKGNLMKPEEIDGKDPKVMEIVKQGKLKVTFELYSQRREIPAVLLVTPGENQNAKSLPRTIKKWVEENYTNENQISKEDVNTLLFTVMTKADMLLNQNAYSRDTIKDRVDARFNINFENFFSDFLELVPAYNNIYMTINTGIETISLLEGENKDEAREVFLDNDFVVDRLGEKAEEVFDSLYTDSKGIERLKNDLLDIIDRLQTIKETYVQESIDDILRHIYNHADNHLVEANKEEQLLKEEEQADAFMSYFSDEPGLYSVLIHYINHSFPDVISVREKVGHEDPLELDSIFNSESSEEEEFGRVYTELLDNFLNNLTDKDRIKDYKYFNTYLKKIDEGDISRFFSKAIDYLRSEKAISDQLAYILSGIDINDKYQRRAFKCILKYKCVSEITGYNKLNDDNVFGQKGLLEILPKHLDNLYTFSMPTLDKEANDELKSILQELK